MEQPEERVTEFTERLRPHFAGEIRLGRFDRVMYSCDASIYQIEPLGILLPTSHSDVAAAIELATALTLPLLSRGGGTSLAGQTVGEALVLDYSKYMNRILAIDVENRCARVEPGVVLDQLNAVAGRSGLQFGPDVATSNRATLGGMIGNNSCGARSVLYGKTIDHVRELRILTTGAGDLHIRELSPAEWRLKSISLGSEGTLYRAVNRLVREHEGEIRGRFPGILRHVGGYNLDALLPGQPANLCRLVTGSEGTLGAFTEAVVDLVPIPPTRGLCVVHYRSLPAALESVTAILELDPAAIELIDRTLLSMTRAAPGFARLMNFVDGDPEAVLIVQFYAGSEAELAGKLDSLERKVRNSAGAFAFVRATTPAMQERIWAVRKAGLGLLSSIRGDAKPVAFVEDTAVPPRDLARYVSRFVGILAKYGTKAGIYGHASVGCLHIRPFLNLKGPEGVRRMVGIASEVKDLVREFGGAMSGEHGDGLVRSHWNRELFGDELYEAFRQLKRAFDPAGIMNPGKIVDSPEMTSNLRYDESDPSLERDSYFDFAREGGLLGATEQCSGLGACRKVGTGTMCPSYMATLEEEHSTRGRANALRAALTGRLSPDDFDGERMRQVLDLCLECKACKTECPAGVDVAKLKFEFLAHYNRRHGIPLRSRLFGNIALLSQIGSATAPFSNWILKSSLFRHTVMRLLGIHPSRTLPEFSRPTFRSWLRRNPPGTRTQGPPVVLFNDTFTNYNEPGIGRAALRLLESTGGRVSVPDVVCCGRSMISKGMLEEAREQARKNVLVLAPLAAAGATIVGCEPSCLLTLRDEYPELLGTPEARLVAEHSLLLEEFLDREEAKGRWKPRFAAKSMDVLVHGHCHQKSLAGTAPMLRVLGSVPGFAVKEIDSGCCGMAGAFGFEAEHFRLSLEIGEQRLFPALLAAPQDAAIVACGTSCRQQIRYGTGRAARHLAEVLAEALQEL